MDTKPVGRESAKLAQIIRLGRCPHPFRSVILEKQYFITTVGEQLSVKENGFIEYCSDCNKVLEVYTP